MEHILNEHQMHALNALLELKQICDMHHITYFLLAGSVLGAVRHHGFIPWDDDIDVGVKYDEIEMLESCLQQYLSANFRYVSYTIDESFPRLHGKILYKGRSCVDIFPLVRLSDKKIVRNLQWNTKNFAKKLHYRKCGFTDKTENKNLVIIAKLISPLFSRAGIFKIYKWCCELCDLKKTKDWINISSIYSMEKETIPYEQLEHPSQLLFEGHYFSSVRNTDQYLTNLYGNYMELPPVEKRIPAHIEIFDKYV